MKYIVLTNAERASFANQEDREYFAKPVAVELLWSCVSTRLLYVKDPVREHTYPIIATRLRSPRSLTNRERLAAGI